MPFEGAELPDNQIYVVGPAAIWAGVNAKAAGLAQRAATASEILLSFIFIFIFISSLREFFDPPSSIS
jgi:hypothetical protein